MTYLMMSYQEMGAYKDMCKSYYDVNDSAVLRLSKENARLKGSWLAIIGGGRAYPVRRNWSKK
jgi:hypothetical protein